MNKKLLDILVCPLSKQKLIYDPRSNRLISKSAKCAYPVRDGIPIMLIDEAQKLSDEDLERL